MRPVGEVNVIHHPHKLNDLDVKIINLRGKQSIGVETTPP